MQDFQYRPVRDLGAVLHRRADRERARTVLARPRCGRRAKDSVAGRRRPPARRWTRTLKQDFDIDPFYTLRDIVDLISERLSQKEMIGAHAVDDAAPLTEVVTDNLRNPIAPESSAGSVSVPEDR